MTESDRKALEAAGNARKIVVEAAKSLEIAFEEIDDHGAGRASPRVSRVARQLREAAELLENLDM